MRNNLETRKLTWQSHISFVGKIEDCKGLSTGCLHNQSRDAGRTTKLADRLLKAAGIRRDWICLETALALEWTHAVPLLNGFGYLILNSVSVRGHVPWRRAWIGGSQESLSATQQQPQLLPIPGPSPRTFVCDTHRRYSRPPCTARPAPSAPLPICPQRAASACAYSLDCLSTPAPVSLSRSLAR